MDWTDISTWPYPLQMGFVIITVAMGIALFIYLFDEVDAFLFVRKMARKNAAAELERQRHNSRLARAAADGHMTINEARAKMLDENKLKLMSEVRGGTVTYDKGPSPVVDGVLRHAGITYPPEYYAPAPDVLRAQCGTTAPHGPHNYRLYSESAVSVVEHEDSLIMFCEGR